MEVVAGITLKQLQPRVWDQESPYYLSALRAVMISYADFHRMPAKRREAMKIGLRRLLGVPKHIRMYLDNGAFYFSNRESETSCQEYEEFVREAQPDWWPIPQDFIPTPKMSPDQQYVCLLRTMAMNQRYGTPAFDGYTPVIHISQCLDEYIDALRASPMLKSKPSLALGGIVPNLLRVPKAMPHGRILASLQHVRQQFAEKHLHVFGIGGTATLHIAALLRMDSVDSSGWRNRAARGLIQLSGTGDRSVADLGNWRGRAPSGEEWEQLACCQCPACTQHGIDGIRADKSFGFAHRATHNLWTLLEEARLLAVHIGEGSYQTWYKGHLDNTIYRPLIDTLASSSSLVPLLTAR